jgi:hypothetical protein
MATVEFKAKFNAKGFVPGIDISEEEWELAISEFLAMQNQFAQNCNKIQDKLNENWEKYETIKRKDELLGCSGIYTRMTQQAMGISDKTTYGDWLERWYKEVCDVIDECAEFAGFHLRSNLHREEDLPMFGAKFKDRPDWKIELTLEQVEN